MKRLKMIISFTTLSAFAVLFGFQNCSKVDFGVKPNEASSNPNAAAQEAIKRVLSLGLMTQNMACVMCHTEVSGNISGFGTLTFRDDSEGYVAGNIYGADQKLQSWIQATDGSWVLNSGIHDTSSDPNLIAQVLPELISQNLTGSPGNYSVRSGEQHNTFTKMTFIPGGDLYTMTSPIQAKRTIAQQNLVMNPFLGRPVIHESDFPSLDITHISTVATGTITLGNGQTLSSPINANLILVNGRSLGSSVPATTTANQYNTYDASCPASKTLTVSGEFVVKGDLILSGCIKGHGTIYATGNIYIPDDIKNPHSAFPYTRTINEQTHLSEALNRLDKDMISLGAGEFILLGALRTGVITHEENGPVFRDNINSINRIYSWLSTSNAINIYNTSFLKQPYYRISSGDPTQIYGAISLVEANLYANKGIATTLTSAWASNIVFNGSIITPNLAMLSTGWGHSHYSADGSSLLTVNPFNGTAYTGSGASAPSQINQDFRLKYTELGYDSHRIRTY